MEREKIHQLAISYFEGRISLEEESVLFDFISESEENSTLFKSWEKSWMLALDREDYLTEEWSSLQTKMETRKAITTIFTPKSKIIPLYRKIAVVAAIVVVTMVSTLLIDKVTNPIFKEKVFVVETPGGEKSRVTLPDGSIVWLNSTSQISYSSLFGNKDRNIALKGEAYFEVKKNEGKPFIVKTGDYDVVVKGTRFNVSSYADDLKITTTLMEGEVEIIYGESVLALAPGELLELDVQTHQISKARVNPEQYKSWIENKIEYDSISLDELLNRLSRQYNVKIHLSTNQEKSRFLNISIKNDESLEEILRGLALATPMEIEYKDQEIYIELK